MQAMEWNPAGQPFGTIFFAVSLAALCYLAPQIPKLLRRGSSSLARYVDGRCGRLVKPVSAAPPPIVTKELDFPEGWWSSEKLYALEKRAILSKTWLLVTHSSSFKKLGDYRTFVIGDFDFLVILGKDGVIRAFHNVCRHRAYAVCTKAAGSSMALRCRYHGWTYDSRGKLVKAPKFDDVAGFDRSQNGLFEIRTFIDSSGFLYANFDVYGSDGLAIRVGLPIKARLSFIESWAVEGKFNWKFGLAPKAFHLWSLAKTTKIARLFSSASGMVETWTWPDEFELAPLTRMIRAAYGDLWLTVSILPSSASTSAIHCTLYSSSDTEFQGSQAFVARLRQEVDESVRQLESDFELALQTGDVTDSRTQEPLLAEIRSHSRLERLLNKEVFPASRLQESSQACQVADDLCRELEAEAAIANSTTDALSW